jgi:GTPase Era involved in 16S rRNA processing/ankyrin repeat protein
MMNEKLEQNLVISFIGTVSSGKTSAIKALFDVNFGDISPIAGSTISVKTAKVENNVYIVDAPGFGDFRDEVSLQAKKICKETDIFVYIINAEGGYKEQEKRDYEEMLSFGKDVLVVLNKIDLIRKKDLNNFVEDLKTKLNINDENFIVAAFNPLHKISKIPINVDKIINWLDDKLSKSGKDLLLAKLKNRSISGIIRESVINEIISEVPDEKVSNVLKLVKKYNHRFSNILYNFLKENFNFKYFINEFLCYAVDHNDEYTIDSLLEMGANVNTSIRGVFGGYSAISPLRRARNERMARFLISRGASFLSASDKELYPIITDTRDLIPKEIFKTIMNASQYSYIIEKKQEELLDIINSSTNKNTTKDIYKNYLLNIKKKNIKEVIHNYSIKDLGFDFYKQALNNKPDSIDLLKKGCFWLFSYFSEYLLIEFIKSKNISSVKQLLKAGVDPNISFNTKYDFEFKESKITTEMTPLLIALANNDLNMVKTLLHYGASPWLRYYAGDSKQPELLFVLIRRNIISAIELLLKAGLNDNIYNIEGITLKKYKQSPE